MPTSFLERFYDEVRRNLSDPSASKRYPKSERYLDLWTIQQRIHSRLLSGSGQDSDFARTELDITVSDTVDRYMLPPGFRQFIAFEKRVEGDKDRIEAWLPSLPTYGVGPGIRILGEGRGFEIVPTPNSAIAGTWTMVYRRGPVKVHAATAANIAVNGLAFDAAAPATDFGELVALANYYAGATVRIYSANAGGYPQTRVIASNTGGATVTFTLEKALSPVPAGTVKYEICPELPEELESIYAMDVALLGCARRRMLRAKAGLKQERHELWSAVRGYYGDAAADRPPERSTPPQPYADNPWE